MHILFYIPSALRALRSVNYRLFFAAEFVSLTGLWMHRLAMGWLVLRLTDSNSALGLVDFTASLPIFLFTAIAGSMVERWDLRKTLVLCQTGCMFVALALAIMTLSGLITFKFVILMSLTLGLLDAFELPCRYSLVSFLVNRREDVGNAVALNSMNFNITRMIGPTLGGFTVHAFGEGLCFLINAASYLSTIIAVRCMKMDEPPISRKAQGKSSLFKDTIEGLRLARDFAPNKYLLILTTLTGFLCFPSIVLMPAMAKVILHGTSKTLGFLLMGVAIGALAGSALMASRKDASSFAKLCTRACTCFGIAVLSFSLSRSVPVGIILAIPIGFCMVICTIACNTLLQTMAPLESKSRIMALYTFAVVGVPPFGSVVIGWFGDMIGTNWVLFVCGLCSTAVAYYYMRKVDGVQSQIEAALIERGAIRTLK